jgi:hypothetical protein
MFDDQATPRSPFVAAYSPRSHPDTLTDSIPLLHSSLSIRKPELNARQIVVELLTYNLSVDCIRSPVNYFLPFTLWLRRENSIMLVVIPDQYRDKSASGIRVQLMG